MTVVPSDRSIANAMEGARRGMRQLMYKDGNGKYQAKVCCFCDCLIGHNDEKSIKVGDLRAVKARLSKDIYEEKFHLKLRLAVKKHYTVQCLDLTPRQNRDLCDIMLSRRSYQVQHNMGDNANTTPTSNQQSSQQQRATTSRQNQRQRNNRNPRTSQGRRNCGQQRATNNNKTSNTSFDEIRLGACGRCESEVRTMQKDHARLPKVGIASGMAIGGAPKCLLDLNDVELALIKSARINKHIFSFQAGGHKMIRGWHSLYYNNVDYTNGVANYLAEEARRPRTTRTTRSTASNNSSDESSREPQFALPMVLVVLVGPFTTEQRAKTMEKTAVNWRKICIAVRWLKANNPLYSEYELPAQHTLHPMIIDDGYVHTSVTTCKAEQCCWYEDAQTHIALTPRLVVLFLSA